MTISSAHYQKPSSAIAYCTAEKYSLSRLQPLLESHYSVMPFLAEGLLHIRLSRRSPTSSHIEERETEDMDSSFSPEEIIPEAYIFSDGTFVTWGATQGQTETLLKRVRRAEVAPYRDLETEHFDFYQDPSQYVFF